MVSQSERLNDRKSVRTTVSIPTDDYAELERIASGKKVSVAWVVRDAVERYLNAEAPLFRHGNRPADG
ncbi:MAG: CopG family transcriptional regulator [Gemmataceae bacterium]|nr:CopG family transcriptional regulator [Gemmataceae bacterium]